jgi:IS30 family transposase
VLIHRRPPIVETRTRIGDWEGDLIVGKHSRSAIGTLVNRTSRAVRLIHLPCGHSAEAFTAAFADVLGALPEAARRTLTWDQGSEMARHDVLAEHFEEGVFFADPGSPWQRGTNENTNGLLRQFFPKGKDLSVYTVEDLRRAEKLLNSRPRKILNWHTPDLVFTRGIG